MQILNRQQLAQFLPNHEAIKAFEQLFAAVSDTLPTNQDDIALSSSLAQLQAGEALAGLAVIAEQLSLMLLAPLKEDIPPDSYGPPTDFSNVIDYYVPPFQLDKTSVSLGSVDNTSDANKPVSTAQATAIGLKLDIANPSYTGTLTGGTGVVNLGSGQFYKDTSGNIGFGTANPSSFSTKVAIQTTGSPNTIETGISVYYPNNTGGGASGPSYAFFANNASSSLYKYGSIDVVITGNGSGAEKGAMLFKTSNGGVIAEKMRIDGPGNIYGLAGNTTMTDGFFYIPSASGAPTGVPTAVANHVPMYFDSTNNNFYVYNATWKKVLLT